MDVHEHPRARLLAGLLSFVPLAVAVHPAPRDSTWWTVSLGGGAGSYAYVTRGCEGEVLGVEDRSFTAYGGAVEYKPRIPFLLGLRGTVLTDKGPPFDVDGTIWNPYAAFETRGFSVGGGYVHRPETNGDDMQVGTIDLSPVSGHVRFGRRDDNHFEFRVSEGVPLVAPAGMVEARYAFPVARPAMMWVALGSPVPYDGVGLGLGADVRFHPRMRFELTGRAGVTESRFEGGLAGALTVSLLGHDRVEPAEGADERVAPPLESSPPIRP